MCSAYFVEGDSEVDFEEPEVGVLVLLEGVAKGVSHDLDPSFAPDSVIPPGERVLDVVFTGDAEALRDQPANRVPASQGAHRSSRLLEGDRHSARDVRLEETGGFS